MGKRLYWGCVRGGNKEKEGGNLEQQKRRRERKAGGGKEIQKSPSLSGNNRLA